MALRLASLNTWKNEGAYPRRLELMASGLESLNLDVLLLQEVFIGGGWNTADWLGRRLGLVGHSFPARRKRRLHNGRSIMTASGMAILARTPVEARSLALESDPRDGERIAVCADLAGGAARVLNLHLSHLPGPSGDVLRKVQLNQALAWARDGLSGTLLIGGDLNAQASADCLKELWSGAPPAEGGSTTHGSGPAIDHLVHLGGPPLVVERILLEEDFDGLKPSDHCGLFSIVEL